MPVRLRQRCGVVEDVARDTAGGAAVADLECAAGDGGEAGEGVVAGQKQRFRQRASVMLPEPEMVPATVMLSE